MAAIFQAEDENILADAAWTGTDPVESYSLTTFEGVDPAARVLYDVQSATVTATITSDRGDVLVVPATNADGLTVTNGAGLSEVIPIPVMTRNRIPATIVCDLTALEPNNATRTSTVWHFAFTCSSDDLVLGGAIALYSPKRALLQGDFQWGGTESRTAFGVEHQNEYGVRYLLTRATQQRSVSLVKLATQDDLDALQGWFDGSGGKFGKALLWPDPDVNDAFLGTVQERLDVVRLAPTSLGTLYSVAIQFQELSKGRPV